MATATEIITETKYEPKRIGHVNGLGEIFELSAPFHKQVEVFQNKGIAYATPEDIARIRLAGLSNNWSRTNVAPITFKGEKTVLYKPSPLMNLIMAKYAVNAHSSGQYPVFPRKFYELARNQAESEYGKEPEDRSALILSNDGDYELTPEMPETMFLLRKFTKEYFDRFEDELKISLFNLTSDLKRESIVNYLGFGNPHWYMSNINCRNMDLNDNYWAFGVLRADKISEATQKNLPSRQEDVEKYISLVQGVRKDDLPASQLEEVVDFFKKL